MKRLLLILLLVAGCGHGSSSTSFPKPFITVDQVATRLGCASSLVHDGTQELYAADSGWCDFDGGARIYTFSTNTARDNYVRVAEGFGKQYVVKDHFVVTPEPSP